MTNLLRAARETLLGIGELRRLPQTRAQVEYVTREVGRLAAAMRHAAWRERRRSALESQTKASFDFQWQHLSTGVALPSDAGFMGELEHVLPTMVGVPRSWFPGKRVVDVGCGVGRYARGLLQLGAGVTACDQSEAALTHTAELCAPFRERLALKRVDLLEWHDLDDFDLAFSYGVVHHTGNTYLAIENVCRKVRCGGRVFFMIYAVPDSRAALQEVNLYELLAEETRDLGFEARKEFVLRRFGRDKAHGWFDAISPRINDRLTFEEIRDLLVELGFDHITGTRVLRNHYVTAERVRPA